MKHRVNAADGVKSAGGKRQSAGGKQDAVAMITPTRVARSVVLAMALLLLGSYAVAATRDSGDRAAWLVYLGGVALTLALPLPALLRGRASGGFWYALLSTGFVAHGVALAVDHSTRGIGLMVLASALVMFLGGGLFFRVAEAQQRASSGAIASAPGGQ